MSLLGWLTGCSAHVTDGTVGATGISHDGYGGLTIHVVTCNNSVQDIHLMGGFYDGPKGSSNPPLGSLHHNSPQHGYFSIALKEPTGWEVTKPITIPTQPDKYLIVTPVASDRSRSWPLSDKKNIAKVALTMAEIYAKPPGKVILSPPKTTPDESELVPTTLTTEQFQRHHFASCT